MEDETSNDVIITDSSEIDHMIEIPEDKPLMQLFKRLIGDSKQNTVLTNSQIINILQRELHIEVLYIHELEVDIYLNLMKKYLKDWPQWDAFDRAINKLKNAKDYDSIRKMLDEKYCCLKEYLKTMLDKAAPIIEEVAGETIKTQKNAVSCKSSEGLCMEVQCSRSQLNELFLRQPRNHNSKIQIFNVVERPPRIMLKTLPLKAILSWWKTQVEINMSSFVYKREMPHHLDHTLVNKKLNMCNEEVEDLPTDIQVKVKKGVNKQYYVSDVMSMINRIILYYSSQPKYKLFVEVICEQILLDLKGLPSTINLLSHFRRYMSAYPYIRYLYASDGQAEDVEAYRRMYDLQLQEIVSPKCLFTIGRIDMSDQTVPEFGDWIKIRCGECNIVFDGEDIESRTIQHYSDIHQIEPDWQCTRCKKKFSMSALAECRWGHVC